MGWDSVPKSIRNFSDLLLSSVGENRDLLWWLIAAVGWALWKTRNDLVFSNIVIKSPKHVAYRVLGFL